MKKIRIISGTYGSRPRDGSHVVPIDRGQCCEVPDDEAARLVSIEVAEYVEEAVATPPGGTVNGGVGLDTPNEEKPLVAPNTLPDTAEGLEIVDGHFSEEGLSQMTNENLRKLATDLGLDPSKCKKKDDFVALLLSVELEEEEADEDDGNEPPTAPDDTIVP